MQTFRIRAGPRHADGGSMADYEDILYDNNPFSMTHPDHLHTLGALFGMRPAPIERCRVLELGCGLGGNLVPLAALFPESTFVGIDLSKAQIAAAEADARSMGLANVQFRAMDILDLTPEWGEFDYILCHGVFSWVPEDVQDRILAICRVHLAPHGIAYISYNTYPGWHVRGMIRQILRRHATAADPRKRIEQARALLSTMADLLPGDRNPAARWLKGEVSVIGDLSDAYVLYEHLVEVNTPLWFEDFVDRSKQAGLQYVADAEFHSMFADRLGPDAADRIGQLASGLVKTEQYLDYMHVRFFRRSLVCRREVRLDRALSHERLRGRWIASRLELLSNDKFKSPEGMVIDTHEPLVKAALKVLTGHPQGLAFETLCHHAALVEGKAPEPADHETIGGPLLELLASHALRIGTWPRPWVGAPPDDHPVAPGFARHQATQAPACTNLMHRAIGLDALDRALIARMDGRSKAELAAVVLEDLEAGRYKISIDDAPLRDPELIAELIDKKLVQIAKRALILDPARVRRYGPLPGER